MVVGLDEWDMYDFLRLGEPTRFFLLALLLQLIWRTCFEEDSVDLIVCACLF